MMNIVDHFVNKYCLFVDFFHGCFFFWGSCSGNFLLTFWTKRTIRITTEQHILKEVPPVENYPMRQWSIQISMLDSTGNEIPANILDKVTYTLHPTFANPIRSLKLPPFKVEEQGWGEFDIPISFHILGLAGKSGERKFNHDLNFLSERYVTDHVITIPVNPAKNQPLNKLLLESGSLPFDESGIPSKRKLENSQTDSKLKKSKNITSATKGSVDLEKLANGLSKLNEDDLIVIVQMVTDNRTNEMNIKNDVDNGEFTMDLYTLPESLLKSLWDYVKKHTSEA
jgi:transcription initiation factor TFIID/TFIIF subunit